MDYPEQKRPPTALSDIDFSKTYTAKDYIYWDEEELKELIGGKIQRVKTGYWVSHQITLGNLFRQVAIKDPKGGEVWLGPLSTFLTFPNEDWRESKNVVLPDFLITVDPSIEKHHGYAGVPSFIAEVIAPETRWKDVKLKFDLYQRYGVREYWLISYKEHMIIQNLLNDQGKYETQRPAVEGQVICPRDFPELKVDLEELFKGLKEEE